MKQLAASLFFTATLALADAPPSPPRSFNLDAAAKRALVEMALALTAGIRGGSGSLGQGQIRGST